MQELDKTYQQTGRKILRAAEEFFKEEKIEIETKLEKAEDPADRILQMVKELNCDLLIIGNVSDTRARRFSLGSVAEKISLYSMSPVLIAKRKTEISYNFV